MRPSSFWSLWLRKLQYMEQTPTEGSRPNLSSRSSTTIDEMIVFPAPGIPGQKRV